MKHIDTVVPLLTAVITDAMQFKRADTFDIRRNRT